MLLYTISGAPRGWRVQTALMFKGLDYELRLLAGSKKEHKQQPYLGVNPRGLVPVIEHDGQRISDSLGIMAWLDRAFPEPPLFGATAAEAGAIWSLATDLEDHMRSIHHAFVFPLLVQKKNPATMSAAERDAMGQAAEKLFSEFQLLENRLTDGPFFFGGRPSAADAVAFPDARLVRRANDIVPKAMTAFGFNEFSERYPRLNAWMAHIETLPDFEKCLPPHWSSAAA